MTPTKTPFSTPNLHTNLHTYIEGPSDGCARVRAMTGLQKAGLMLLGVLDAMVAIVWGGR